MADENNHEILFREYELCQSYANSIESSIWQAGSVLGIGSIGTIIVLLIKDTKPELHVICGIGFLIIWLISIWRKISDRWLSIQHAKYFRMREIESELKCVFTQRYIVYLNDYVKKRRYRNIYTSHINKYEISNDKKKNLDKFAIKEDYSIFGTRFYSKFFLYFIYSSWIIFAIYILFTFKCTIKLIDWISIIFLIGSPWIFLLLRLFTEWIKIKKEIKNKNA